jgi:transposase
MEVLYARCAGLGVHATNVVACVRIAAGAKVTYEHRTVFTTTRGLLELTEWLTAHACTHVALEATGVYWKPVWHVLEDHFTLVLANAMHIRNIPGRKSDKNDAMWIADLLALGLIRSSFVPPAPIQELRDLTRTRKQLVREMARHTQRIQKTLKDANIKLTEVVSDILGVSGRAILLALLRGSFRPTDAIVALRAYLRHRQTLIESAGTYVQRMQKALVQMNLQLPLVVSDITGLTGLRILRDIIAGHRDPHHLAEHRDPHCRASKAEIAAALTGNYRPEHLFVLQQNLELFDTCQVQLAVCDRAIDAQLHTLTASVAKPATPLPAPRVTRKPHDNEPQFDIRTPLHHLTGGVDVTQIDGIKPYTALKLIAEIGTDMSRWATEKHFTSWLTLAPNNKISGSRLLSSRTQPSANRAAAILRLTAMSVGRTQTALGAFYRRLAARIGKPQAITATARKLAILVYRAIKGELRYQDPGAATYDAQQRTRVLRRLRQRAAVLGFELVNCQTGEVLPAGRT